MPSRTVTIQIKSLADLKAITNTINAMTKMSAAANKLNSQWKNAADAKQTASAMRSMGTALKNIETHGPGAVTTMKNFTTAIKNLDKALAGIPIELRDLATAIRRTAESTKSWNDQNKALNKQGELITNVTNKLDQYGRVRERITRTARTRSALDQSGNFTAGMAEQIEMIEQFDAKGKLLAKTMSSGSAAGGAGAISTSMNVMAKSIQTVQARLAPFIRMVNMLGNTMRGIGTRAWQLSTHAINTFGQTASATFARLRTALAQSGGFFTAFHRRVEDSMMRSKRATIDFLNSGWSFLTSGYTTRAFGEGLLQRGGAVLTDYMDYERNLVRTAVAGSTSPDVIQDMIFRMQRGEFGQAPVKQFSAEEIAEMAYFYASAIGQRITGDNVASLAPVLANFLQIANVARTAPEIVTKGIINAATEFGIDPRRMENIPQLQQLGTQMAYLSNISTLEFPDIAESFKMVGPLAAQLGASPQDAMALLYLMSEAGLRGGQAGRGISQTFSRLLDPTEKMLRLSEEYGMTPTGSRDEWHQLFFDEAGELRGGVGGMLATLKTSTETPQQMAQIVAELFSENATRTLVATLAQMFRNESAYSDIVEQITGTLPVDWLGRAVEENNQSLSASFVWLKGAWFQVVAAMVGAIEGPLKSAFDFMTETLYGFADALQNNPGVARFIAGMAALVGVVAEVVGTLFIAIGSTLLMAKAFSLTSGFGIRFGGVLLGIAHTFARLTPTLVLASGVVTAFAVAWKQDFLGVATFFRELDLAATIERTFDRITSGLRVFGRAWFEFITLILGGEGTTDNLRNILETLFGQFLGTTMFGQILRLRDAIRSLFDEISDFASGTRGIDFGAAFANLGPTIRGLIEFASTGILGADVGVGMAFFEALGFEDSLQAFVDAGLKLREVFATIQNVLINFKNALQPILEGIWQNLARIFAVLTDGRVVVGTFGSALAGFAASLVFIASGIEHLTGLLATLLERFRWLVPIIGAVAGVLASVLLAKALIPFDKQLFHATATLIDFTTRIVILGALQGTFLVLAAAAQVFFAVLIEGSKFALAALTELIVGLELAEGAAASLEAIGQVMSRGLFMGLPAMALAVIGITVAIAALGLAIYELWQTNEDFRDRMIDAWSSIRGIVDDFIEGFIAGFVPLFVGGFLAITQVLMVLVNAFSMIASPILGFIDAMNAAQAVGFILGAALAALSLALVVDLAAAIALAIIDLGLLIAQFTLLGVVAIISAIEALVAWVIALGPVAIVAAVAIVALAALLAVMEQFGLIDAPFENIITGLVNVASAAWNAAKGLFAVNRETESAAAFKEYQKKQEEFLAYDPRAEAQKRAEQELEYVQRSFAETHGAPPESFGTGRLAADLEVMYQQYLDTLPPGTGPATQMDRYEWFRASGGEGGWKAFFTDTFEPMYQPIKDELGKQTQAARDRYTQIKDAELKEEEILLQQEGKGLTGIKPLDDVLSKFSLDRVLGMLGIDAGALTGGPSSGQFASYADYEAAEKRRARQLAIERRFKELQRQDLTQRMLAGERLLPSGETVGLQDLEGRSLGEQREAELYQQAIADVNAELASGAQDAQAMTQKLQEMTDAFNQSIAQLDLGQILEGVYGPLAGPGRQTAGATLFGLSGTILENLKTTLGGEELPWQNEFELMMDAAGFGPGFGTDVTGKNLHRVLRPFLEDFAAQSGVSIESLLKDIPMFAAPQELIPMAQFDLMERMDLFSEETYRALDLLGSGRYGTAVYDAEGIAWSELANFGAAQARAGFMDWNLTDYIMEAWDLTRAEAEAYIAANHLDPDIITGETFADTKLYSDAMGGQVNVITEEWLQYYNSVTKDGTDKTIEITQAAFDALPDIIKIGFSNMGAQFIISAGTANEGIIASAQATRDALEQTYGNIPNHLERLLKPISEGGGGWTTSVVDGIVTIYDELGNIKFTMPESDYTAWVESNNILLEEARRLEDLKGRLEAIELWMQGLQSRKDEIVAAAGEAGSFAEFSTQVSIPEIGGTFGGLAALEESANNIREDLGWIIDLDGESVAFDFEGLMPTAEEVETTIDTITLTIGTELTEGITELTPGVQGAMTALMQAAVTTMGGFSSIFAGTAQTLVNTVVGTLNAGAGAAGGAGYRLGEAAGLGVLRGLQAHLIAIQNAARNIVTAAQVGNSTPVPAWNGGRLFPGNSTTGTTAANTSSTTATTAGGTVAKTLNLNIGTVNAGNETEVNSLVSRIDEELGNKYDLARRGMYATSGTFIA